VKGTTTGTVTNSDGGFSLRIPSTAEVLQLSFVGLRTQEIALEGRSAIQREII
ncbi:MAG: carboxypeptidase-like regulatory domain-containing protein, partial [Mariniphaga sp.]|nr:carboxypeptidase-like regulatory domain-containing protein [Mariniphaga sp.]